jgi:hypothetical protein
LVLLLVLFHSSGAVAAIVDVGRGAVVDAGVVVIVVVGGVVGGDGDEVVGHV